MTDHYHWDIISIIIIVVAVISLGTVFYMVFEDWNFVDSIYFSVATLSTVGYGDLHPTKIVTKIFTIF